ncbi:MAG: glycosyltransferase family A protein [Firmicutes bacterium]|nr:glycosyltransferase family A protein [Bacillota bacterium]
MISVILPIYRVERYIGDCLQSLLCQTCRDFELILVNDGTPDASMEVARRCLKDAAVPCRILETENRGVSAARNKGIAAARGEYFITVDADDRVSPTFLERLLSLAERYPQSDVVGCGFQIVKPGQQAKAPEEDAIRDFTPRQAQTLFARRRVRFVLPALLIRRQFVLEHKIAFDEAVRYSEDVQYIWRLLAYTEHHVLYLPSRHYYYVFHEGSTMTASDVSKVLTGCDGVRRLAAEIQPRLAPAAGRGFEARWMLAMLHGAAKMLSFYDFLSLYDRCGAKHCLSQAVRWGEMRLKLSALALRVSRRLGYGLLKHF